MMMMMMVMTADKWYFGQSTTKRIVTKKRKMGLCMKRQRSDNKSQIKLGIRLIVRVSEALKS